MPKRGPRFTQQERLAIVKEGEKDGVKAVCAKYVGGRIRKITFSAGPNGNFHGPQCFGLILEVLRGDKENPIYEVSG